MEHEGATLKQLRIAAGLSQVQAAARSETSLTSIRLAEVGGLKAIAKNATRQKLGAFYGGLNALESHAG